jgi:GTP-binding protein EngB required for normal cell division
MFVITIAGQAVKKRWFNVANKLPLNIILQSRRKISNYSSNLISQEEPIMYMRDITRPLSHQEIKQEADKIQLEIQSIFQTMLLDSTENKLKPEEQTKIENNFQDINEFIEMLKVGLISIALFGKYGVGKSSIINSLIGDDIAEIAHRHDVRQVLHPYKKEPWFLHEFPFIMDYPGYEKMAFEEAKKAHGIIFVISGEPYLPELELFELVHNAVPNIPKLVFVNKLDRQEFKYHKHDLRIVRQKITEKMGKFVNSPNNIIYGSARLYDQEHDEMVHQKLPQLLNRMYEDTGRLGQMMNILDPDHRNESLNPNIRDRILAMIKNYQ